MSGWTWVSLVRLILWQGWVGGGGCEMGRVLRVEHLDQADD